MYFCQQLICCLIVDEDADIIGIPVENDLTKSDTDGDQMYETSEQCNDTVFANCCFNRFVGSQLLEETQGPERMCDDSEAKSTKH